MDLVVATQVDHHHLGASPAVDLGGVRRQDLPAGAELDVERDQRVIAPARHPKRPVVGDDELGSAVAIEVGHGERPHRALDLNRRPSSGVCSQAKRGGNVAVVSGLRRVTRVAPVCPDVHVSSRTRIVPSRTSREVSTATPPSRRPTSSGEALGVPPCPTTSRTRWGSTDRKRPVLSRSAENRATSRSCVWSSRSKAVGTPLGGRTATGSRPAVIRAPSPGLRARAERPGEDTSRPIAAPGPPRSRRACPVPARCAPGPDS